MSGAQRRRRVRSTAAPSLLPPAMPAQTGMLLRMSMDRPGAGRPVDWKNRAAALLAMLPSPLGRKGRSVVSVRPAFSRGVIVTTSCRSMDCITMRMSW